MHKYKCVSCSTTNEPVYVTPIEEDGYLKCPHCGSIELCEVNKVKGKYLISSLIYLVTWNIRYREIIYSW
ncbi:MAG: hypothetical protein KAJ44_02145 [Thermoplasmatales archaeon]|nr:hypothetical protein [Thermoplasmatales archaeon]